MKKRSKRDIEIELDVINSFGMGILMALIYLWAFSYFGMSSSDIYTPLLILIGIIIVRSIYLKIKLKRLKK